MERGKLGEIIKVNTFLGDTWEGVLIRHKRDAPKSVMLIKFDHIADTMEDVVLYKSTGKRSRYYIKIIKNEIQWNGW